LSSFDKTSNKQARSLVHVWRCVIVCISMGYIGPVCVIVFFIISTVINKFLMSPVVSLVFLQEQLEGDFR